MSPEELKLRCVEVARDLERVKGNHDAETVVKTAAVLYSYITDAPTPSGDTGTSKAPGPKKSK